MKWPKLSWNDNEIVNFLQSSLSINSIFLVIDRFVHLLSVGMSLPVIERINTMFKEGHIDVSLVRHVIGHTVFPL
jgi:hypothetical protein